MLTRILAGAASAVAALTLGLGGASAANAASAEAPEVVTHTVFEEDFPGLIIDRVQIPPFRCPASHPYLLDRDYTREHGVRNVINGVRVHEPGGIGVTIDHSVATWDGRVVGWDYDVLNSATAWFVGGHATVTADCTNDRDAGNHR